MLTFERTHAQCYFSFMKFILLAIIDIFTSIVLYHLVIAN